MWKSCSVLHFWNWFERKNVSKGKCIKTNIYQGVRQLLQAGKLAMGSWEWESRPWTSSGLYRRTELAGSCMGEKALRAWEQETWPPTCLSYSGRGKAELPPSTLSPSLPEEGGTSVPWVMRTTTSWPCPLPAAALMAVCPASLLGSTVEPAMVVWVPLDRSPWWCWGRAGRLTNSATSQAPNQGYKLACSNIHSIYELLEHIKGS